MLELQWWCDCSPVIGKFAFKAQTRCIGTVALGLLQQGHLPIERIVRGLRGALLQQRQGLGRLAAGAPPDRADQLHIGMLWRSRLGVLKRGVGIRQIAQRQIDHGQIGLHTNATFGVVGIAAIGEAFRPLNERDGALDGQRPHFNFIERPVGIVGLAQQRFFKRRLRANKVAGVHQQMALAALDDGRERVQLGGALHAFGGGGKVTAPLPDLATPEPGHGAVRFTRECAFEKGIGGVEFVLGQFQQTKTRQRRTQFRFALQRIAQQRFTLRQHFAERPVAVQMLKVKDIAEADIGERELRIFFDGGAEMCSGLHQRRRFALLPIPASLQVIVPARRIRFGAGLGADDDSGVLRRRFGRYRSGRRLQQPPQRAGNERECR